MGGSIIPVSDIKKAIEADIRNDMKWHLGRDYALCAELFKRKSDLSKAKENLGKAIEILRESSPLLMIFSAIFIPVVKLVVTIVSAPLL